MHFASVSFSTHLHDVRVTEMKRLSISEREIRAHGPRNLLAICWKQWITERALAQRGIRFRSTNFAEVEAAYAAMTPAEFDAINGRQAWANWRTIPRGLSGNVPERPLRVLDLGCGGGTSTQVLAFYCPRGSVIIGYDLVEPLIACAQRRVYRHRSGAPARVEFRRQRITDAFRRADGTPVADDSVDVVNACGVVGQHLTAEDVGAMLNEVRRVLQPAGIALLDPGPRLRSWLLCETAADAGFEYLVRRRSWFGDPNGEMVFRKRPVPEVEQAKLENAAATA